MYLSLGVWFGSCFITFVLLVSNKATKMIQHISYLSNFISKLSFVVLPHSIMV